MKFVNGTGTTANVTVTENGAVSAVKFDVKKTTLTADADKGTVSAGNAGDSFATAMMWRQLLIVHSGMQLLQKL